VTKNTPPRNKLQRSPATSGRGAPTCCRLGKRPRRPTRPPTVVRRQRQKGDAKGLASLPHYD
jgi:hypothetical protein